jgi:hypothetical protein
MPRAAGCNGLQTKAKAVGKVEKNARNEIAC